MSSADGKIETVITYLDMTAPPKVPPPPLPLGSIAIMKAVSPTLSFYRYLYNTVGEPHLWWERRVMPDDELEPAIKADNVDVMVLYVGGVPAGYYELTEHPDRKLVELTYFGLIPDFVGRGYGAYLLRAAIDDAWSRHCERLTVHTCNLDHPNALRTYQKAGFNAYDQEVQEIEDPKALGIFS